MTVVSRLHSYHDEVGRMGVIIPILQNEKAVSKRIHFLPEVPQLAS